MMQRYTLTEYDQASPGTQAVFDDFMRTTGATSAPVWLKSLGYRQSSSFRAVRMRSAGRPIDSDGPLPMPRFIRRQR